MSEPKHYRHISLAIAYIRDNFKDQPSLEQIAASTGLSTFHFQRLFSQWAGVSPKQFMQYLSVEYAKQLLRTHQHSLLDTAYATGLSGTSRLHDLFVNIEGMTPGEYKNGGEKLVINYCFSQSPFGKIIIASTLKGICHLFFEENEQHALSTLRLRFPNAQYQPACDHLQQSVLSFFTQDWQHLDQIKLHLKATPFQLKVWQALLKVPFGNVASYAMIANGINKPKASRAVGTAISRNPVAFLIPCHRVIRQDGNISGYMWGETRKSAMLGWEAAGSDNGPI